MMTIFKKRTTLTSSTPFGKAWQRFQHNLPAQISLYVLVLFIVVAILGYAITPDKTTDSNTIIPELSLQKAGSSAVLLKVPAMNSFPSTFFSIMLLGDHSNDKYYPLSSYSFNDTAIVANLVKGTGLPNETRAFPFHLFVYGAAMDSSYIKKHFIVHRSFLLGTDSFGRDIFSRLLLGLRISLSVGLIAVIISLLVGITLGSIAGYFGGRWDTFILWIMNVIWAIPTVLLVFAITIILGKGFWQIFIAVGLTTWVGAARIIRGQVMQVKQMEYIEAAKSLGYSTSRIIIQHILPNILGPVMVVAASNFATAILLEAGLSFLGIGVQPPTPSWGSMIKDNYGYIVSDNPAMAIIPGIAIMVLVLLINLVGNGIRDAFDVKTKAA